MLQTNNPNLCICNLGWLPHVLKEPFLLAPYISANSTRIFMKLQTEAPVLQTNNPNLSICNLGWLPNVLIFLSSLLWEVWYRRQVEFVKYCQGKSSPAKWSQVKSIHVKSNHIMSSKVMSSQVKSSHNQLSPGKSSQAKSSQVKVSQVKSSQAKTCQFKSSHVQFSQVNPRHTQPLGCAQYSTSEKLKVSLIRTGLRLLI